MTVTGSVSSRLVITGYRWGVEGVGAVPGLRGVIDSGDFGRTRHSMCAASITASTRHNTKPDVASSLDRISHCRKAGCILVRKQQNSQHSST